MNLKQILILVLLITSNSVFAQQSLNEYKYVIVPINYDFLKLKDQYQLNSLTKFLFKKEGFETLFDNEVKSQNLAENPCLGLVIRVNNNSSMMSTKLIIELLNCKNEIVHTSIEGKSKDKDFKKGYHEALRKAFQSIASLDYKYNPIEIPIVVKKEKTVEVQKPTDNIEEVIHVKVETVEKPVEVIEEISPVKAVERSVDAVEVEDAPFAIVLYAQPNPLGFQLVDSTPKVVYVLLKSTKKDLYFLKNRNGIVFKEAEKWFAEYYNEDTLVKVELLIKF